MEDDGPPPGLKWKPVCASTGKKEDMNSVVCSTFKTRPWELWSYLNWLELIDQKESWHPEDRV